MNTIQEFTKVVHVNSAEWDAAVQASMAVYIGIGRRNIKGFFYDDSEWANPYKIGKDGDRLEVIAKFEAKMHHWANLETGLKYFRQDMLDLRGKVLGCWCKPQACHGDVLARLAEMDDKQFKEWLHD